MKSAKLKWRAQHLKVYTYEANIIWIRKIIIYSNQVNSIWWIKYYHTTVWLVNIQELLWSLYLSLSDTRSTHVNFLCKSFFCIVLYFNCVLLAIQENIIKSNFAYSDWLHFRPFLSFIICKATVRKNQIDVHTQI